MTAPFTGEIQVFSFNFAPYQWATCAGQIMPVSQNTALFSLLGTNYGGNGSSTFGLPNFSGMAACSQGQGLGLTQRVVGEIFGTETVALLPSEIPLHNHNLNLHGQQDQSLRHGIPANGDYLLPPGSSNALPFVPGNPNMNFAPNMLGVTGEGLPHENRQPLLALNFCIALYGTYPQRP